MSRHEEWLEWTATRPPEIRAVAEKFPAYHCYRSNKSRGHYIITAYTEGVPVTVKIAHGADSFLPGVEVFGVDPEELVVCDCREWEWPSQAQADATRKRIDAERERLRRSH